jgi:hypothetical protein
VAKLFFKVGKNMGFFFSSSQTFKKLKNILQNRQNSLLG